MSQKLLGIFLLLLSGLYGWIFLNDKYWLASFIIFTLPPLILALGLFFKRFRARFWAGVWALFWFSHGVISVYPDPTLLAWLEIILSIAIIIAANWLGLSSKFNKKRI